MDCKLSKESCCAVIGHGSWATAIVKVLTANESAIGWYIRNAEVMESLRCEGHNCRYLPDVDLDISRIRLSDDLNETLRQSDIIFLITPAAYLKSYLSDLQVPLSDKFVVSAIKGIIPDERCLVTQYLHEHYQLPYDQLGFISGPTHAEEVSHNRLTHLTLACSDLDKAMTVGEKISTSYMKLNYSREMRYLEILSVLKNVYAVMVGIAFGMGYGDNFLAVLVANCTAEMHRYLDESFGHNVVERIPSSFLGDLLVSCYSIHGRNRRLGVMIGRGNTVKSSLNEMTMVAEGYFAADYFQYLPAKQREKMPIAELTYQILYKDVPARKAMKQLEAILV